jgi:class 3 adenylate cyclase
MSDDDNARVQKALLAYLRQDLTAPASAISGYVEILIDDAKGLSLDSYLPDLERIRTAGSNLSALLQSALAQGQSGDSGAFNQDKLRHDLRTPINAIKGYGEMLMEDAADSGQQAFAADLGKLLTAADGMLKRIDALVNFKNLTPDNIGAAPAEELNIADHAIRSIRAVSAAPLSAEMAGRILVVDDNELNRDLLTRQLTRLGHTVQEAAGGHAALAKLESENFDLVLLDLMMPDISGYEVLRRMKGDARTHNLPVILISALDDLDSVIRCIEAGAVDYLLKPFDPTLLRARIGSSLENKLLRDREKLMMDELQHEKARYEDLLLSILPRVVIDRINGGEKMIADQVDAVTILFADIVGFTQLASRYSAANLVDMLNDIFSRFDNISQKFGAEKIKTIGDAYMVAFGLPEKCADHQEKAALLAIAMLDEIKRFRTSQGHAVELRVGIHTGPAIAGVIGHHKFSFDVWGTTVNLASRMESHGTPGQIHITEAVATALKDRFTFVDRGVIEVKGAGMMRTFFLGEPIAGRVANG